MRFDSALYRDYISSLPCIVPGCKEPSDPHHTVTVARGGSDLTCIPVSRSCHVDLHQIGQDRFLFKYDINLSKLQQALIEGFLRKIGADKGNIELPEPKRKAKVSQRKNREKYVPYQRPWEADIKQ